MKKHDVISEIASGLEVTVSRAEEIYLAIVHEMMSQLERGGTVKLTGFGSFRVGDHKSRLGTNPRTGRPLRISSYRYIKFRAGKNLHKKLNKKVS